MGGLPKAVAGKEIVARLYQPNGSSVWWSDLKFPSHPKADRSGRLRIPLARIKAYAQTKLGKLIEAAESAKYGHKSNDQSYESAKTRFLKRYQTKSKITLRHYLRAFRNLEQSIPTEGPLSLTPESLIDLYVTWKNKGRGLYVRNRDLECIVAFVKRCEAWGVSQPQEWRDVLKVMDREPRGRVEFFTTDEVGILLNKTYGRWRTMTMLGARAGLRPGEMFWLEKKDVDLIHGKIHIDSKPKHGWNVKSYERRTIPMPADLKDYLKRVLKDIKGEWVIGDEEGTRPSSPDVLSTYYSKRVRAAGLKGHLYKLRHTYGSHLAQANRRLEEIRDLMGHKDTKTTEIYVHLLPHALTDAVNSLPAIKT